MDAGLVSVGSDSVVGDADSHPGSAFLLRALADELHDPDLVLIGDSEGFAGAVVAVVTDKIRHDADGFTGARGALKGYVDEATIVHNTLRVVELLAPAPSTLGDGDLMLVHIAHDVVGDRRLRDIPKGLARIPLVDLEHKTLAPRLGRIVDEVTVERVRVGRIADHDRAIDRSLLAHDQVGASLSRRRCPAHESQSEACEECSLLHSVFDMIVGE